jgi:hypothetical protein
MGLWVGMFPAADRSERSVKRGQTFLAQLLGTPSSEILPPLQAPPRDRPEIRNAGDERHAVTSEACRLPATIVSYCCGTWVTCVRSLETWCLPATIASDKCTLT